MAIDQFNTPGGRRPRVVDTHLLKGERSWNPVITFTRDGDGNITLISETDGSVTIEQTWTWSGNNLTSVSAWAAP